jgi:hypothetical protein
MNIDINLLKQTERLHYDDPTCGVLIDTFRNGSHWHAVAIAEKAEWYCHNGFGDTKEQAVEEAVVGILNLVKNLDLWGMQASFGVLFLPKTKFGGWQLMCHS